MCNNVLWDGALGNYVVGLSSSAQRGTVPLGSFRKQNEEADARMLLHVLRTSSYVVEADAPRVCYTWRGDTWRGVRFLRGDDGERRNDEKMPKMQRIL